MINIGLPTGLPAGIIDIDRSACRNIIRVIPESPMPRSEDQSFARLLCSHAYVGGSVTGWLAYDNLNTQLKAIFLAFS
jgi:hypothetical protein